MSRALRVKPAPSSRVDPGHPLARGLIAAYLMNEGAGIALYPAQAGVGVTSAPIGTFAGATPPSWRLANDHRMLYSLDFDGSSSRVDLGVSSLMPGECSFVAWINTDTVVASARVICENFNATGNRAEQGFEINRTAARLTLLANGNVAGLISNTDLVAGLWYQVVGTRAGGLFDWTFRIFVNGVEDGVATNISNPHTVDLGNYVIGQAGQFAGGFFDGQIAHLLLYNRPLTPTEVAWLYAEPYAMFSSPRRVFVSLPAVAAGHPAMRRFELSRYMRPVEIGRKGTLVN